MTILAATIKDINEKINDVPFNKAHLQILGYYRTGWETHFHAANGLLYGQAEKSVKLANQWL